MIVATIIITMKYASDADMQEAEQDKQDFEQEFRRYFAPCVAQMEDIYIDHAILEVKESKT